MIFWIVSYRVGTDMLRPQICFSEEDAEDLAAEFIAEAALEAWEKSHDFGDGELPPEPDELEEWAEEKGYVYSSTFFWDGSGDGYEVMITEQMLEADKTEH